MASPPSDATRYLCVGAESDDEFAEAVLDEIFTEGHRRVAPSYGVDVVPIIEHSLRNVRRRRLRDVWLTMLLIAEVVLAPLPALLVGLVVAWVRWIRRRSRSPVLGAMGLVIGGGAAAWALWAWAQFPPGARSGAIGRILTIGGLGRIQLFLLSLPVFVLLSAVIRYAEWHVRTKAIGDELQAGTFRPGDRRARMSDRQRRRLDEVGRDQAAELAMYDAHRDQDTTQPGYDPDFHHPFVGAGALDPHAWSFALNLQRPAEADPHAPPPEPEPVEDEMLEDEPPGPSRHADRARFTAADVSAHVRRSLEGLRVSGMGSAADLAVLHVDDKFIANGLTWYQGGPLHDDHVRQANVANIRSAAMPRMRHFLCCRIESWKGELVTVAFLHVAVEGMTLYVQFLPFRLSPVDATYRYVDYDPYPSWRLRLSAAADVLWTAVTDPFLPLRDLGIWLRRWGRTRRRAAEVRRALRRGDAVDRGAVTSIREMGMMDTLKHHYLQLDARKYVQVVEAQIMDALVDFLERNGIETADLRNRQKHIQDQGVFVHGSPGGGEAPAR